jgi:hypothetical protein
MGDGSEEKADSVDAIDFGEEEKKEDLPLILDDLSSSDVCASCSELN